MLSLNFTFSWPCIGVVISFYDDFDTNSKNNELWSVVALLFARQMVCFLFVLSLGIVTCNGFGA